PTVVSDGQRLREVATEASHVRDIVDAWHAHQKLEAELAGARGVFADEADVELREMAREEIASLEQRIAAQAAAIKLLLVPRDPYEGRALLLEIRAGTGGDEAALFA